MAKVGKNRVSKPRKCKTPAVPDPPEFSKNWMRPFLDFALASGDIEGSCEKAEVGLGHYLRARRSDPAFAVACVEVDIIGRHAAQVRLQDAASKGQLNASKLKLWMAVLESIKVDDSASDYAAAPSPSNDPDIPAWIRQALALWTEAKIARPSIRPEDFSVLEIEFSDAAGPIVACRMVAVPGYSGHVPEGPCRDCLIGIRPLQSIGPTRHHTQAMRAVVRSEHARDCPNIPLPAEWVDLPVLHGEIDRGGPRRRRRLFVDPHAETDDVTPGDDPATDGQADDDDDGWEGGFYDGQ